MPYACVPKIPISPGKLQTNIDLMQPVVKNAKSRETEPGCQAYFFFIPEDGNESFLYGMEIYDDEKAIKETHFNSNAFQTFAAEGQKQGVNPGPPEIAFGHMLGGWLSRPGEGPRGKDQVVLFSKFTLQPGKRDEFNKLLLEGLDSVKANEPDTLSILLVADENNPDVTYVMERFKNKAALEAHMNNPGSAKVREHAMPLAKERDGGYFKAVAGFISKDE